jgi:hypothetical protein
MKNIIRIISIVSYFLIILVGQMIGLPFIFWLIFTVFDFGNIDQLFAIFGVIGIGINLSKWKNNKLLTIVSFALMLSPIISRLKQVPIEMFDYLAFEIPLTIFIIGYLIFIVMNILEKRQNENE